MESRAAAASVVVLLLALATQAASVKPGGGAQTCSALGFSGLHLCSDCETFATHVRSNKGQSPLSLSLPPFSSSAAGD